jgi:hypothetical protein
LVLLEAAAPAGYELGRGEGLGAGGEKPRPQPDVLGEGNRRVGDLFCGHGPSDERGSGGRERGGEGGRDRLGYRLRNARQTASGFLHKALLR